MEQELKELTHQTKKHVENINLKEKQIRKIQQNYIFKEEKGR
jgi:hypothetical protein